MTDPTQAARTRFDQGFSCLQSVFSAFAAQFGIDEELALKIASPFGGRFARQGKAVKVPGNFLRDSWEKIYPDLAHES